MNRLKVSALVAALFLLLTHGTAMAAEKQSILIYGATGSFGGVTMLEALARGHRVTGVSRTPEKYEQQYELFEADFAAVQGDITDYDSVRQLIEGFDVVVVSVMGPGPDVRPETSVAAVAAENMVRAMRDLGDDAPRVIQIGGGSTLYLNKDNAQLYDIIPNRVKGTREDAIMWGHHIALDTYLAADDVEWTVFTPPPAATMGKRGVRTGNYQISDGYIDVENNGEPIDIRTVFPLIGGISQEDLAVVLVDEIEDPKHIGKRFSAWY